MSVQLSVHFMFSSFLKDSIWLGNQTSQMAGDIPRFLLYNKTDVLKERGFAVMNAAIHGIILAFGLILPLGAQNVLIFQQGAASSSIWRVMPLVISASLCDSLLIILAVTGISAAVAGLPEVKFVLLAGGVLFLIYMGWITWRRKPAVGNASEAMPAKSKSPLLRPCRS